MKNILFFTILIYLITGCNDNSCTENLFCTEEIATVFTEIKNKNDGSTVLLDSTITKDKNGTVYSSYVRAANEEYELYAVIGDLEYDLISFSGTELIFSGWKDGNLLFESEFEVGKDCCHVRKLSGPEIIEVNP